MSVAGLNAARSNRPVAAIPNSESTCRAELPCVVRSPGSAASTLSVQREPPQSRLNSGPDPVQWFGRTLPTQKPRRVASLRIDGAGTEKRPVMNEADASVGRSGLRGRHRDQQAIK